MGLFCSTEAKLKRTLKIGLDEDRKVLGIMYYNAKKNQFILREISIRPADLFNKETEAKLDRFEAYGPPSLYNGKVSDLEKVLGEWDPSGMGLEMGFRVSFLPLVEELEDRVNLRLHIDLLNLYTAPYRSNHGPPENILGPETINFK